MFTYDHTIKMIGLDLDGTVLTKDKIMPKEVAKAIEEAADKGIIIVPVTGRPISGIPKEILQLKGVKYAITSNGAVVVDLEKNEFCETHFLSREVAKAVIQKSIELGCVYNAFINGMGYCEKEQFDKNLALYKGTPLEEYVKASRRIVENIWDFLDTKSEIRFSESQAAEYGKELTNGDCVENMWVTIEDAQIIDLIEDYMRTVDPQANVHRMQAVDVEMVTLSADKGAAFLHMAAAHGIKKEETMAIGDSINDIGFLKSAGLSVAMGNAADVIKEIADYITEDSEHCGVASAIRKFCG